MLLKVSTPAQLELAGGGGSYLKRVLNGIGADCFLPKTWYLSAVLETKIPYANFQHDKFKIFLLVNQTFFQYR